MTRLGDVLRRVRARIADRAHWTRATFARDARGFTVGCRSPEAVRWCMRGAVYAEVDLRPDGQFDDPALVGAVLNELEKAIPSGIPVSAFNDTSPHRLVIEVFDRAIAACEASS